MRTGVGQRITPVNLLIAAGVALAVLAVVVPAYPHLVSYAVSGAVLAALRVVTMVCLAAILVLPVAAIVRQLMRKSAD